MIELYTDGGSAGNPGPSGIGIYIKNGADTERHAIPIGESENHAAEFEAFIRGLTLCLPYRDRIVSCRTDSQAVVSAVEKRFIKNKRYAHYLPRIEELVDQFPLFFIKWIPSKENHVADSLARKAVREAQQKKKESH